MSQTLEQRRAKKALEWIMGIRDINDDKFKKKYSTHVHRTPARVLNNGLGQALAFLLADGGKDPEKPSGKLYSQMQCWLSGSKKDNPQRIYSKGDNLIKELMENDRRNYMLAQAEALALLNWMKKFADAYLPKENGQNGGD